MSSLAQVELAHSVYPERLDRKESALDAWARQQPETLAELAARFVPLSAALDGLNGALYSETGQHWQGEELWKAIRSIPAHEREQDPGSEPSSLPPLYPK